MPLSTRKTALAAAAAFGLLALAACGGGGGGDGAPAAAPQTSRVTLPEGHTVASGSFTVPAGRSVDRGGVRFSCAAGGAACAVMADAESGQARVTGGRLTVARVPAATPQPASVTLPQGHSVASGSFTVPAGQSVDRGGVRFSCAAGGAACAVTANAESGQARVTGGRLTVARVPASPPVASPGNQGGMEETDWPFPAWPVADVSAARTLMGGSALSWSSDDIYNRIRAIEDRDSTSYGDSSGHVTAAWCTTEYSDESHCSVEYRSVMTYREIPIVQARVLNSFDSGVDGRPGEEIGLGGILDHGYFTVARQKEFIGRDYEDEEIGAKTYVHSRWDDLTDVISTGSWAGALVGTGNSATSPLYQQFIIGDVDVTVELGTFRVGDKLWRNVDVAFSNIRNVSTGGNVTLSHMRWRFNNQCCKDATSLGTNFPSSSTPGYLGTKFRGPNDEEVFGAFYTEEAVGAFGAKKR